MKFRLSTYVIPLKAYSAVLITSPPPPIDDGRFHDPPSSFPATTKIRDSSIIWTLWAAASPEERLSIARKGALGTISAS